LATRLATVYMIIFRNTQKINHKARAVKRQKNLKWRALSYLETFSEIYPNITKVFL